MEILVQIFQVCIIPLLGILTSYLVSFLKAKKENLAASTDSEIARKYTEMIIDTVTRCVIATNQTYVDTLKKEGRFDAEAQKEAFNMTLNAVLQTLSEDAKQYVVEATGDLNTYLTELIESLVHQNK